MSTRPGSLLIDALLSIAIFAIIVSAFSSGITTGQKGTVRSGNRTRAVYLAGEGLEAIRSIRDQANGFTTIAARSLNQNDGVQLSGTTWAIVEDPTVTDGIFTRAIVFSSGVDSKTRKVTSTVSWTEQPDNQALQVSLVAYLTDWHTPPPPPPPVWGIPILRGDVLYTDDSALEEASLRDVEVKSYGANKYAFAADAGSAGHGMIIFDVSNITNPTFSSVVTVAPAYDIAISGNYAYLATNDFAAELKILDISNPLSVSCCVSSIDLGSTGIARGVSITGTGLYIVREASAGPELYIYDIGDSATSPTLIASIETNPDTRSMYAVAATGTNIFSATARPYAYVATNYSTQELTVASVTGAVITGGGDTPGNGEKGKSVAIFNTGAYLGVKDDDAYEVFSFNIFERLHDPNAAPTGGGNNSYNLGGTADASDSANDMGVVKSFSYLFIAAHAVRSGVNHFLHVLNVANVHNINSLSQKIYDGAITSGYETDEGLFYRESDNTLFMVGGDEWSPGSDLIILQPTYTYD